MKINIYFLIAFILTCVAFIGDIIIYLLKLSYPISILISFFITIIFLYYCNKKKLLIVTFDFDISDIILFIAMFFITIMSGIVYPDFTYDTVSYHEYLQSTPFIDKVNFDFFPGRIFCTFLFPLGDRMYYILRVLFGYRFGMILSFFSILVVFYQIKNILKLLTKQSKISAIVVYAIFLLVSFITNIGTYYIDNICIMFTLQVLYFILNNEDILKNKYKLYIITLISGIAIGIKITQIFFIIPLYIYMIFKSKKDFKEINFITILICTILIVIPYAIYLVDNFIQTGSILFPYYNSIFKSEYYPELNWIDERFNISGIIDYLFWPVIKGFTYSYYGDEHSFIDPLFGIAYLFTIINFVYRLKTKKKDTIFEITILALISYLLWMFFMKGYFRYGIFVGILFCIIMFTNIIHFVYNKIINKMKLKISFKIPFILLLIYEIIAGFLLLFFVCDLDNGKYIFKDRDNELYKISIDGVWGAPKDCTVFVSLVREENAPIYSLHKEYFEGTDKTLSMWEEKIKNNDIYTIIDYYGEDFSQNHRVQSLEKDGFVIEDIIKSYTVDEIPYMNSHSRWVLVKLKYVK